MQAAKFVSGFVVALIIGVVLGRGLSSSSDTSESESSKKVPCKNAMAQTEVEETDSYGILPTTKDYGKVREGQAVTHTFKIKRPENGAIRIGRTYSPCPCVYVSAKKPTFKNGEDGVVEIKIHSLTLNGKVDFPAYVELLEPEKKTLRADVRIEVERVPAKVRLTPDAFHLGTVREQKTSTLKLYNLTKRPVQLGEVTSSIEGITAKLSRSSIAPGGFVTVTITTPDKLPQGPIRGTITIPTNIPEHATIAIPVDGTSLP